MFFAKSLFHLLYGIKWCKLTLKSINSKTAPYLVYAYLLSLFIRHIPTLQYSFGQIVRVILILEHMKLRLSDKCGKNQR